MKAGEALNGTMMYALGTDEETAPDNSVYSEDIPAAKDLGTYYVWYKAAGDSKHVDSEPSCVVVKIASSIEELGVTFVIEGYFAADADPGRPVKIEGEDKLTVKTYSVFGFDLDINYVWELADPLSDSDYVELTEDGTVTFHKVGTYYARVRYGDFVSEPFALHATPYIPAEVVVYPTANNSVYTGSPIALVSAGTAESGTMKYALGTDDITAPSNSEYSEEIPTATEIGTYYVWHKVFAVHEFIDSDPECISVEITATEEELNDIDDNSENTSRKLKKSSGGCDSGFSLMSLGILLSGLIIGRKSH